MTKKKKIFIAAIGIITIITIIGIIFFLLKNRSKNETGPILSISEESGTAGGEVSVTVSVKNNPGLAGFVLDLEYDSQKLKPVEVIQEDILSEGLFHSNLDAQTDKNIFKVTWFNVSDLSEDGSLYTVKFKILSKEKGTIPITLSYEEGNIANQKLETVDFKTKNAKVTVKN